jgi:hypothetical protein
MSDSLIKNNKLRKECGGVNHALIPSPCMGARFSRRLVGQFFERFQVRFTPKRSIIGQSIVLRSRAEQEFKAGKTGCSIPRHRF